MSTQSPILDLTGALEALGNDRELYEEIITLYVDTTPSVFNAMETGVRQNDREAIVRNSHSLKSSSRTIGAMKIGSSAKALEKDATSLSWESIRTTITRIKAEFNELCSILTAEGFSISSGESNSTPE